MHLTHYQEAAGTPNLYCQAAQNSGGASERPGSFMRHCACAASQSSRTIILDYCTSPAQWYKLAPDSKGRYTDGSWSPIAPMPAGYSPLYFAQQVLPGGNVIVNGGEYNDCKLDFSDNNGALYDYTSNSWTSVSAPACWSEIGAAESIILPDGTYMLANCCDDPGQQALASISGTTVTWTTSDSWTCHIYSQECMLDDEFTPLPDGNVLLVDVNVLTDERDQYRIYDTQAGTWSEVGTTADYLNSSRTDELGPSPLTLQYGSQGTVIQFTANSTLGVNDIYSVSGNTWTSAPVLKVGSTIYDCCGAPAATLPDGNILVQARPARSIRPPVSGSSRSTRRAS
ncbi:MAG TPA: hypothetical protein VHX61_19985 [Rhizomicrobium sp.]|jgi:hypothetical protein|nr:hypothetical protein [Rhizomicrobium sp.]